MTGINMKNFNVIEERGCDIEYCIFQGNYEDCRKEIEKILHCQDAEDPRSIEPNYHNGNGDPYSYRIDDSEGFEMERHMALCYGE